MEGVAYARRLTGRCDAGSVVLDVQWQASLSAVEPSRNGAAFGGSWIRRVIEMSSETMGNCPKTFRYSWSRPMGNLLKNPRFSKGTRELQ